MKKILVAVTVLIISACASTQTAAPEPAIAQSSGNSGVAEAANPADASSPELSDPDTVDMTQVANAPVEGDKEEKVCRLERETGSRFTTRICRTKAEIEERRRRDQEIIRAGRKIETGSECALSGLTC